MSTDLATFISSPIDLVAFVRHLFTDSHEWTTITWLFLRVHAMYPIQYPIQSIHLLVTRLQLETITILSYAELFETSSASSDTVSNLFALTYLSSHNPAAWTLLFRAEYRASSLAILYGLSRRSNLLDSVASCLENDRDFVAFHETSVYLVLYGDWRVFLFNRNLVLVTGLVLFEENIWRMIV